MIRKTSWFTKSWKNTCVVSTPYDRHVCICGWRIWLVDQLQQKMINITACATEPTSKYTIHIEEHNDMCVFKRCPLHKSK